MHLNLKQMNRLCPPAPSVTEWMHGHGRTAEKVQDNFKAIHLGARGARALCLREQQPHGTGERGGEVGMRLRPLAVHAGGHSSSHRGPSPETEFTAAVSRVAART